MEVDSGSQAFAPVPKNAATILCADCGAPVDGTISGAFCYDCIKLKTDVTGGVPREAVLHMCRDCDRWLSPPTSWVVAAPESRELLALCLRKLRGLNKLRIIDASFIWTEPHSRRIKVKITVQSEINEGAILQQSFECEFTQNYHQCPDCAKSYTHNTWRACVQVRQKVPHKRTFLYLEQLILKHGAHKDTINIKEVHDGIDFFFAQRNNATTFCDFLKAVVPVNIKKSEELISMDIHTSTRSFKFSFSCEILPICKDDLVVLPIALAKKAGNINPLTLCTRIGTSVQLLDPSTLQTADIATDVYWRTPFRPLADVQELTEFIVLDIDPLGKQQGRNFLAEATVARASDMGVNDQTYYCRTHLGGILHVGDSVMGYLLCNTNFNSELFDILEGSNKYAAQIPDVMLVKKFYQRSKKSKKNRNWRLKRMNREEGEMLPRKQDQEKMERDFEMFLQDVEEDVDLRQGMALYKAQQEKKQREADAMETDASEFGEEEEEGLTIPMEQLLDDFDDMTMEG